MSYRYYIGLNLPTDISKQIVIVQKKLFDPNVAIPPLEPHITLLPPPAVAMIDPEVLAPKTAELAQPFWPLQGALQSVETFKQHAVAIAVQSEAIHRWQQKLVTLLPHNVSIGHFPGLSFHPHVTLSQTIRGKRLPLDLALAYEEELRALLPCSFQADRLTLYKWQRPRHYQAIAL
ncbi:MAG TPA: 2'-5' RNA ligase family protein [Candidatus Saccharimonadales bacterium]|nr:2'-5' RNA ligase family protein [Candidatus Saccharimonadales bacterium]